MLDRFFPLYALVFLITLTLTAVIERRFIPFLKIKAQQPIYEEGPSWHLSKSGTPTMGGIAFLTASTISLILASLLLLFLESWEAFLSVIICLAFAVGNALIGFVDDLTKLRHKKNAGLTPKQKLFLQFLLCTAFLLSRALILKEGTSLYFSFGEIDLGYFYYPLSLFVMLGLINSANLTDGIDGLASSVAFAIGISLFYISASLNSELAFISSAIIGASIGFLFFNIHPAKIFMGDTGSLFLGALIASTANLLENGLVMLIISGVYVVEGFSVVLQVLWYKLTKKRIFKMAPLHHHLEKTGFSENKICLCAIFSTLLFSIPAYIIYLP